MRPRKKPSNDEEQENYPQSEKENIYMRLRKRGQSPKKEQNPQNQKINSDEEFEKLLLSPGEQEFDLNPKKFWAKKLKDLEGQKSALKKRKHGLYEFSETDESQSSYKIKKQKRQPPTQKRKKTRIQKSVNAEKLKKSTKPTKNKLSKLQKVNIQGTQTNLNEEETNILPLEWITSTPANIGTNPTKKPKFMYLSPITIEENIQGFKESNEKNYIAPLHSNSFNQKTPQKADQEIPKKRILRSRKLMI